MGHARERRTRTAAKHARLRELGGAPIDYKRQDFVASWQQAKELIQRTR